MNNIISDTRSIQFSSLMCLRWRLWNWTVFIQNPGI